MSTLALLLNPPSYPNTRSPATPLTPEGEPSIPLLLAHLSPFPMDHSLKLPSPFPPRFSPFPSWGPNASEPPQSSPSSPLYRFPVPTAHFSQRPFCASASLPHVSTVLTSAVSPRVVRVLTRRWKFNAFRRPQMGGGPGAGRPRPGNARKALSVGLAKGR